MVHLQYNIGFLGLAFIIYAAYIYVIYIKYTHRVTKEVQVVLNFEGLV